MRGLGTHSVALALALSALAGCRAMSPGPWEEDARASLAGEPGLDLDELGREAWGTADPSLGNASDLPERIWAYDGASRIYHDRRSDLYVGYDGTHARWVTLAPERALLEFDPARARIVAAERDPPWGPSPP